METNNTVESTTPKVQFSAKALAPIALFMAKNDIRYYLNGICVMPHTSGGCVIAGTDGHRLALWYDKDGECDQQRIFKVTPTLIAASKKTVKGLERKIALVDNRLVVIEGDFAEVFVQAGKAEIDAKYPDITKVVPKPESLVAGMFGSVNPAYVKQLGEAGNLLNKRFPLSMRHYSVGNDGNGKIVTVFDGDADFMVITMPMRGDVPRENKIPNPFVWGVAA